jgi:hypothetical protein
MLPVAVAAFDTPDLDGAPSGIRTHTLNQLVGAWLFHEKMLAFRKSHRLFERPGWGKSLHEGCPCECPVLPIAPRKADLLFPPLNRRSVQ